MSESLQLLRCIHRVADNRVVDPVRRADIADNDQTHMDAHPNPNWLQSGCGAAFIVSRKRALYGNGRAAGRCSRAIASVA